MHICILAWNKEEFLKNLKTTANEFGGSELLVCTKEENCSDLTQALSGHDFFCKVFCPKQVDAVLGKSQLPNSIGHTRNQLLLMSAALAPSEPLVLLDDDIRIEPGTKGRFTGAFSKCDFVQGKYAGAVGNRIYSLVHFFEILEGGVCPGFEERVQSGLRGVVWAQIREGLSGTAGGLMGVGRKLKVQNFFAPTKYPFDDHFFEFSSRFLFRTFSFMGNDTLENDVPVGIHDAKPGAASKLLDDFVLYVKSAIVEDYFYYRLSGCIPKIVGGRHVLVKTSGFDSEHALVEKMREAAVSKFQAAALHYVGKYEIPGLDLQLGRLAGLGESDFFVGTGELEGEWQNYLDEKEWFNSAARLVEKDPACLNTILK